LKQFHKYTLLLILLNFVLIGLGFVLISVYNLNLSFVEIVILSSLFSIIAFISLSIFLRGQTKEPNSQTLHSLVSVSLKFLLEIVLALVWFIVTKKTSRASVLIFFVLYLSLTLFLLWVILKTLKNKSL
jgi:hypothetical protein